MRTLTCGALLAAAVAVHAAATPEEAARLGSELTPLGAERRGNAEGTIPEWKGGLTTVPPGFVEGSHYPDPFDAERPSFVIDAANAEKHAAHLSPGQLAMLRTYPSWRMRAFPTHRTAAFPKAHYEQTIANAAMARLAQDGNGIAGATGGIPFPIPKSGLEAIWNHLVRYRGDAIAMAWTQAPVQRDGSYTLVRMENEFDFDYGNLSKPAPKIQRDRLFSFVQAVTAPPRLAGQILLVHEFIDQVAHPRTAWTYNPGQRRVRLAPNVAYDNPGTAADGLRTNDDFLMFNGATDRYEWTLVGKREMYVPYNAYRLNGNTIRYADLLKPLHINPDLARYELHRVWVVEAKVRPGVSHIYARRTFYIDEDSWNVLLVDKYDARGQLWRFAELHSIVFPDVPMLFPTVEVHYDLQAGRYIAAGMRNEEPVVYQRIVRTPANFTPSALRGAGTR